MRNLVIVFILALTLACSNHQQSTEKPPSQQQQPLVPKPAEKSAANDSEVDALSLALDSAAIKLHKAFKDGEILNARSDFPVHLLLKKKTDSKVEVIFSQLASPRGQKPIKTGKELRRYLLSSQITIIGGDRHFWYDANGNIDFFEADKVFRTFDNPPQADLVLLPIGTEIGRRCYIDIVKERNRLYVYPVSQ